MILRCDFCGVGIGKSDGYNHADNVPVNFDCPRELKWAWHDWDEKMSKKTGKMITTHTITRKNFKAKQTYLLCKSCYECVLKKLENTK